MQPYLAIPKHSSPKIEGLDGLRALAVVAVITYHADIQHFLPGGFLGVDVFFVISGFLISSILFRELNTTGTISFLDFYARRAKRLLPALLSVLFACTLYTVWFAQDAIKALQSDLPPALLYYSNFWQLMDAQPYFEHFGRPHALQHLWSLAIEEQFYFLWPPCLLILFRYRRVLPLSLIVGTLSFCSFAWMAWLAIIHNIPYESQPERLYFGTDTHAMGLLLGAFLATIFRPGEGGAFGGGWFSHVLGGAALVYLLGCFFFLDESTGFLYRGGFASVSLATVFLIQTAARHGSLTNAIFQNCILSWLGKRSYSLYLWHWPVFVYFRPGEELPDNLFVASAVRLCLTIVLAHFTYEWIEQPIRMNRLRALGQSGQLVFAMACVAIISAFGVLFLTSSHLTSSKTTAAAPVAQAAAEAPHVSTAGGGEGLPSNVPTVSPANPMTFISKGHEPSGYNMELTDVRITALGDSVMLGAQQVLTHRLPISYLDAKVGRQGSDLLKLVKEIGGTKAVSDTVLIHIGTNGYIYEQNLKQIVQLFQDKKKLVFINVHANRRWTDDNNALLKKYQELHKNITLIDWNAISENHPEYFVKDGIHLTGSGMTAYANIIRLALGVPDMPNPTKAFVVRGGGTTPAKTVVARTIPANAVVAVEMPARKLVLPQADDASAPATDVVMKQDESTVSMPKDVLGTSRKNSN